MYKITYKGAPVLAESKLGLIRDDVDFSKGLTVSSVSAPLLVKDSYTTLNAKKKNIVSAATHRIIETKTASDNPKHVLTKIDLYEEIIFCFSNHVPCLRVCSNSNYYH